jgi:outer membrane immunogenic protein
LLAYATGGLAYGGVTSGVGLLATELQPPAAGNLGPVFSNGAFSDTRVGWTVGGGLEWLFWPHWSAKVEYLYYELGRVSYPIAPTVGTIIGTGAIGFVNISQATTHFNGNIVRAGVNYHFNWGAPPVVAKY